ncbi:hypothetical protein J3E72DRAFT_335971 [Bipolaris maydis]|uniref:uncharacterized protein n=1 Tax=Cochliobolus heterostrophus TaxID=5016 RepID=UPI0024DC442C|nr:hypothetical protein J3E74DRAFT_392904 [Bipolaris maydis]KAJ5058032.1 hypothetical protein J3E74DRAFT_357121 [Bipolaris maydis]KAJ6195280.1 hypothetical protein J3E72DRAFT_335971 [Bipolaris maydis]KAJ6268780.1 hypothetical protein PSV08DRAFT_311501 [Bipolaris maydis]KAJ6279590.1 hypothetical protein J3E71DRAFT_305792 [Bipolaris maydis]
MHQSSRRLAAVVIGTTVTAARTMRLVSNAEFRVRSDYSVCLPWFCKSLSHLRQTSSVPMLIEVILSPPLLQMPIAALLCSNNS